jgi:GT2 family glycosyltransferase
VATPPRLPEIAVVIPTRGREARLAFALESLVGQLEPERFEVVVVRDADASRPWAEQPAELDVRYLTRPGTAGPTAKRNVGWRATEAPLVAFTDDDCRAAPGWLETLVAAAEGESTFLQGRTAPDPKEAHLLHGLARSVEVARPTGWFETCNMAYPRQLLERLGGFDEAFDFGGEDTDLAWRAIEAGANPVFVSEALVWHAVMSRSIGRAMAEARRWNGTPAVIARHPGLHDSLYRRHFWSPEHLGIAVAGAGLALAGRSRSLALLATLPYLSMRLNWRQPHPRRIARGLVTLPLFAAIDATEVAARLPSAIRHRVAVL